MKREYCEERERGDTYLKLELLHGVTANVHAVVGVHALLLWCWVFKCWVGQHLRV